MTSNISNILEKIVSFREILYEVFQGYPRFSRLSVLQVKTVSDGEHTDFHITYPTGREIILFVNDDNTISVSKYISYNFMPAETNELSLITNLFLEEESELTISEDRYIEAFADCLFWGLQPVDYSIIDNYDNIKDRINFDRMLAIYDIKHFTPLNPKTKDLINAPGILHLFRGKLKSKKFRKVPNTKNTLLYKVELLFENNISVTVVDVTFDILQELKRDTDVVVNRFGGVFIIPNGDIK